MDGEETKACIKCGRMLPLGEFRVDKTKKDGHRWTCKACTRVQARIYKKALGQEYFTEWRREHKEEIKGYRKKYREANRELVNALTMTWYNRVKHTDSFVANTRRYHHEHKLVRNMRRRIRNALHGESKSDSTIGFLGCTLEELKIHLESQFSDGMTWDNHSLHGWHIDHIIPCSVFDMTDPVEQKQCFHFTNLQPLWATDNLRKYNKIA